MNIAFQYLPCESAPVWSLCCLSISNHMSSNFSSGASLLCAAYLTTSVFVCPFHSPQVDRLMELHFKYLEAVQQADKRIEGEKHVSILFFFPSSSSQSASNNLPFSCMLDAACLL